MGKGDENDHNMMDNQMIINAIDDHICVLSLTGNILMVNEQWLAFAELNGGIPMGGIGFNYFHVLQSSEFSSLSEGLQDILSGTKQSYSHVYPCQTSQGESWYYLKISAINDKNKTIGALLRHQDITSMELLRFEVEDVLESMTDAFFALDQDWNFTYFNHEAEMLLKRVRSELMHRNVWDEFPVAVETEVYKNYHKAMTNRETIRFEEFYSPLDTWFEIHVYPKRNGGLTVNFRDINDRKKTEQKLYIAAYYDDLTKLPNRKHFNDKIKQTIEACKLEEQSFALLFLDLDKFKVINDRYGHEAGDELLKQLATRLRDELVQEHFVARVGGDEFIVIYRGATDDSSIERLCATLLHAIQIPVHIQSTQMSVTLSIGVSVYPHHGQTVQQLMNRSDMAMYKAKEANGNQLIRYESHMQQNSGLE